jgi:hypothetical protein
MTTLELAQQLADKIREAGTVDNIAQVVADELTLTQITELHAGSETPEEVAIYTKALALKTKSVSALSWNF